jgi:hypothetical protein
MFDVGDIIFSYVTFVVSNQKNKMLQLVIHLSTAFNSSIIHNDSFAFIPEIFDNFSQNL